MALILQPYCNHYENTTFRVILKMVPPKKSEEKEPKKRTEDGQMGYLRTRSTRENAYDKKKREIKKMKDQPTAGQVTIGVQSSVGKRRFIWTSAQCPHVGAFRFSFLYYLVFLAEVPHFSIGRF